MIEWRLAILMAERRLKNKDLAAMSGLSLGSIKKLRPRRTIEEIKTRTLEALCDALDCEVEDLLKRKKDEKA